MKRRPQFKRLVALAVALGAALAGLGYRLVDLQVVQHDRLVQIAELNTQQAIFLPARRGDILDVKGNLLATSVQVKTVCADPTLIGTRQAEVARVLAPLLQQDPAKLERLLAPLRRNDQGDLVTNKYVRLMQKVPVELWQKIQTNMSGLKFPGEEKKLPPSEQAFYRNLRQKAIFAEDDQLRNYPNGMLAAHVLGYAISEEREVEDKLISEIIGQDGIELMFNSKLAGVRGWRRTEADRQRRELVSRREQDVAPRDGLSVVLTIDSVIQHIVEAELAVGMSNQNPVSISAIVARPRTGEILAMATLPTYDPNFPSRYSLDARRNRVVTDAPEPGSTFKIVVVAGALNDHVVQLTDLFDCEHGRFPFAGRVLHDHEPYDVLSVSDIIMKSSNIGAAKVGIQMGEARLYQYIRDFGFGAPTGVPLSKESRGISNPLEKWSKVSIAQIPMGQGIAVTRLQMMMAMCAIANDGWLMRPLLVDHFEDRDHYVIDKFAPQPVRQVVSEATARQMVSALKRVVSPTGTAAGAALAHYTVAGKTGTAQKAENKVYAAGKYISSFIGFFPADNPELCIYVMLDEPKQGHYGGLIAAPIFKQIAERSANYLNIRPEDQGLPSAPNLPLTPPEYAPIRTASARNP